MHLTDLQKNTLKQLLPDDFDQLIQADDVSAILDALDNLYPSLLDEDYEQTKLSLKCEKLRDEIHWDHFH